MRTLSTLMMRTPSSDTKTVLDEFTSILVRLLHIMKGWPPIELTVDGIVTDVNDVHKWNASDPIVLTPSGMETDNNFSHP